MLAVHGIGLVVFGFVIRRGLAARASGPRHLPPRSRASLASWVVIAVLCSIGLALRLWRLDTDLWLDELLTLTDFLRMPVSEILARFPSQNQHVLYSLLGRAAVLIFGETAAAARLPAVLFGVASIWALFLLGRRVSGTREALVACALMTFSYHHVWFSQNARGYTGLLFFSIFATWLWIEAMERGTAVRWVGYAVSVWLGLWVHMTMIFVVAAHGIVYLAQLAMSAGAAARRPSGFIDPAFRWKAALAWLVAATLVVQAHALALPEFLRSALHEVSLESEWINPMWVLAESVRRLADGGLVSIVVVGGLAALGAGLASLFARDWRTSLLMAIPGLLGGATMIALGHNLWPRFFFFCLGFILLIAVRGVMAMTEWALIALRRPAPQTLAQLIGTAGCLVVVALSAWTLPRAYLPKQDFSGAKRYVDLTRQPGDAVVAVGLAGLAYQRYYAPEWPVIAAAADLDALEQRHQGVLLVYTLPVHLKAWLPEIWDRIQRDYEVVRMFPGTLGGGDVTVCRWRGGRSRGAPSSGPL